MSVYQSVYYDIKTKKFTVFSNSINAKQYQQLKRSCGILEIALNEVDYYIMMLDNGYAFLQDCKENEPGMPKNFIRSNRFVTNYLNSFYIWREYIRRHSFFGDISSALEPFDKTEVAKLGRVIRNYCVHEGVVITKMKSDLLNEQNAFYFDIKGILRKSKRLDEDIKKLLQKYETSDLEAVSFVNSHIQHVALMQSRVWHQEWPVFISSLTNIKEYTPEGFPDCFNCSVVDSNGDRLLHTGRLLELLAQKQQLLDEINPPIPINLAKSVYNIDIEPTCQSIATITRT